MKSASFRFPIIFVLISVLTLSGCIKDANQSNPCINSDLASRPSTCPTIYQPVCGCDAKTYANECLARVAGNRYFALGVCN